MVVASEVVADDEVFRDLRQLLACLSDALFWDELKYFKHLATKPELAQARNHPLIIGANLGKTGTTSLANAASLMGFKSFHNKPGLFNRINNEERWQFFKNNDVMLVDD